MPADCVRKAEPRLKFPAIKQRPHSNFLFVSPAGGTISNTFRESSKETHLPEIPPWGPGSLAAEWSVLIKCASPCRDTRGLEELLRQELDWAAVFTMAEEHGVIGLLAMRLRDLRETLVPPDIRQRLQERHRAQLLFTLGMTAELFRLLGRLTAAGIGTLVVKGPVLSVQAYGDAGLRQYVDLDLLVRHNDVRRATEILTAAGYEPDVPLSAIDAGKIPGEYLFTRSGTKLLVELHTEHTFRYFPRPLPLEKFFERQIRVTVDAHDVPALAVEDELVLICIHGAKHFWERLMWVADVAAVVTRQRNLNWKRAIEAAKDTGAKRMLNVGLRLAADILNARLPEEIAAAVRGDAGAAKLAAKIKQWLPAAGYAPPGLAGRAAFRMRMRGGLIAGPAYLMRLTLSPTEEDWVEGEEEKRSSMLDGLKRPLRLLSKYARAGKKL
jgi:hypothetical protein